MFNVYKNQQSWQTGSRNLTGPKTLPTIWHTYNYEACDQNIRFLPSIVAEKNVTKNILGRTEGQTNGRTEVKQYTPPPVEWGYNNLSIISWRDQVIL
jgi:hypothetical protein